MSRITVAAFFVLSFLVAIPELVTAGTVNLAKTGQTTCYDTAGSVISCAGTGQDGDIKAGVSWPLLRFTDNGDGTVTDGLTGLMWTKSANAPGPAACAPALTKKWQEALDFIDCLNTNAYLGKTDWRLPNVNELETLVNAEHPIPSAWLNTAGFTNVMPNIYWSSTTSVYGTIYAWIVNMSDGNIRYSFDKAYYRYYVWPVRAGQSADLADVWKTGQTLCYNSAGTVISCTGTGQDGDILAGADLPVPRFSDHGNGTVTDNLTGLVWTKNANAPGPSACSPSVTKTWQGALDHMSCLNTNAYLGRTDWRLPNKKELHSLINYSRFNPVLPSGHPFLNVHPLYYWSSTTNALNPAKAWILAIQHGYDYSGNDKTINSIAVWPVSSGLVGVSVHSISGMVSKNSTGLGGVTVTISGTNSAATVTAADGTYSFPGVADGAYTVTPALSGHTFTPSSIIVTISGAGVTAQNFIAAPVNNPPVLDPIGNKTVNEGALLSFTLSGSDADGHSLNFSSSGLPSGASFNPSAKFFEWTPDYSQAGLYSVTFSVSDGSLTDSEVVAITVTEAGSPEVCDGVDNNQNGQIDEGFTDTDGDGQADCVDTDDDNDGFSDITEVAAGSNPLSAASVPEVCGDGIDNDMDGDIDEGISYYADSDNDSYGNPLISTLACTQPAGYSADNTDCNDSDASVYPGAVEIPNDGIDQNCDGSDMTLAMTNISTRGMVQTGDGVMIGGFFIGGTVPKTVLIRARGPSLANFGVAGAMADPNIQLYSGPTMIARNNDWQTTELLCGSPAVACGNEVDIQNTGLDPCSVTSAGCSLDSAIHVTLPPGGYTAVLNGVNNGTGVGIVEVFDVDSASPSKLINISTRGQVLTGDSVIIGGFWISGTSPKSVLLRARGPSLSAFGVAGAMADPVIELYSGPNMIASNDDWQTTAPQCDSPLVACGTSADIQNSGLDPCSVTAAGCTLDSAMHVTLPPGGYTAILKGVNNGTGVGILELFEQ